ncbi:MAG: hypothetical protein KJO53_08885 [Eudoraea sp.]|nr:hypothetical protein [Eudoraea sp.]MBT8294031.1 hypothetical protein [Eudoraea sp.]
MKKYFYIFISFLILGCADSVEEEVVAATVHVEIPLNTKAGKPITLQFGIKGKGTPQLMVSNALGTTVVNGIRSDGKVSYPFPSEFTRKSGTCHWALLHSKKVLDQGKIEILNAEARIQMETYIGPRNIYAGPTDYTMLVAVPTDLYDNPVVEGTELNVHTQFMDTKESFKVTTDHLIGWQRIPSREKASRLFINTSSQGITSRELAVDVHPSQATPFTITYERSHAYADGNQIITFSTSVIRDRYDNIVSDGTTVIFIVTTSEGVKLKTQGNTINGVARAFMLHPDRAANWKVQGFVMGAANSPRIAVDFEAAVTAYEVEFLKESNNLQIGPVVGYLAQQQPDGMPVHIEMFNSNENRVDTIAGVIANGFCTIALPLEHRSPGIYRLQIDIGGTIHDELIELTDDQLE